MNKFTLFHTKVLVTNDTDTAVEVFVTFAKSTSGLDGNNNITVDDFSFLTKVNSLKGKFILDSKSTQLFNCQTKSFFADISFYINHQCPVPGADFHHGKDGTNLARFQLQAYPQDMCLESFYLDCSKGINSYMVINAHPDGYANDSNWSYNGSGDPTIFTIYNKGLQENTGNPGVLYVNSPDCPSLPVSPQPQENTMWPISRMGTGSLVQLFLKTSAPSAKKD